MKDIALENFDSLASIIFSSLKPKIEKHIGLSVFASERAKFEGWLKVELCDTIVPIFEDVVPEKRLIDIVFSNWAIELKTVNTNYKYDTVVKKSKPITKNIKSVLNDIQQLKSIQVKNKGVIFIVFPVTHNNKNWQTHLNLIKEQVLDLKHCEFCFSNKVPGVIYFGKIY